MITLDYFCKGNIWCIRKATTGCEVCLRGICEHHKTIEKGTDFRVCSSCRDDMKFNKGKKVSKFFKL